ncbi:hypothetical protein C8F04DRAFT_1095223 [Mycena alexandri]|uniref:HAUS augmin-like complex subunit 6 N-terminal domain-containing protein n=1 Tax=Mycena alexandri TaxID=1745969 RepID=A0AAD6SYZ7_9AGAR|nr:hypothetical protein C8F04DRAFT_1095223 [Mycena alexandri]
MSASVFTLPASLVLLIHLHLLQYPHANKPEYDHNLFDARVRGLRDRTRTMEDVSYFLITRIEGSKERARKIISTYPCVQPAETTAFRTSLAKFLETLRHSSMSSGRTDSKTPAANSAWWWKDVVVRKSLLEECAGERFERLILALSTHALLKGSLSIELKETQALLRSQPRAYMTHLATFQSHRNAWARSASLLDQRQHDLQVLRFRVQHQNHSNKYDSLSTEKLRALADSTLQDLLSNAAWAGAGGRSALKFLADLSWIAPSEAPADPKETQLVSEAPRDPLPPTPPPPLPIAAAHHPANLRKIIKRVFPNQVLIDTPSSAASKGPSRPHALSERMDAEARMGQALGDALARTHTSAARQKPIPSSKRALHRVKMSLWQAAEEISNVDFEAAQDNGESFGALGSNTSSIEARVTAIRKNLLPKYPPIPALPQPVTATTRHEPPRTPPKSNSKAVWARRLVTKTSPPPETVKPKLEHDLNRRLGPRQPVSNNSAVTIDHPLPALFSPQREEYDAEGSESDLGTATPRPHPKQRQILTRAPTSRSAAHTVALSAYGKHPYEFHNEEGSDDEVDEGPSMSVRDLLLQADMSHFDIIDDDSSEVGEQSFGWA